MVRKRFSIVTFRDSAECDTIGDAMNTGIAFVQKIVDDKWCCEYQWARLIDNERGLSEIMYRDLDGHWHYTNWLALR